MGIARQRIEGLGGDVVGAAVVRAPAVVADPRAVLEGLRLQVREIREGEIVGIENDRGAEPDEGCDAESVVEAGGIDVWEAREIVEASDEVRVQRPVTVASAQGAACARRPFQAVVAHPAHSAGEDALAVKREVIGGTGPVVDTAVGDVHEESRGGELSLGESFGSEPGEIAGSGGGAADEISCNDLILPFVELSGDAVRLDRNDVRPLRQSADRLFGEFHHDVEVVQDPILRRDVLQLRGVDQLQRRGVGRGIVNELYGEQPAPRILLAVLHDRRSRPPADLELVSIRSFALKERAARIEAAQSCERRRISVNQVGVVRDVRDDLRAGSGKRGIPLRLHHIRKLHKVQALTGEGGSARGLGGVRPLEPDRSRVEQDPVVGSTGSERRKRDCGECERECSRRERIEGVLHRRNGRGLRGRGSVVESFQNEKSRSAGNR